MISLKRLTRIIVAAWEKLTSFRATFVITSCTVAEFPPRSHDDSYKRNRTNIIFPRKISLFGARFYDDEKDVSLVSFYFRSLTNVNVLMRWRRFFARRKSTEIGTEEVWQGSDRSSVLFIVYTMVYSTGYNSYEIEANRRESNRPNPSRNRIEIDAASGNCSLRNVCVWYHDHLRRTSHTTSCSTIRFEVLLKMSNPSKSRSRKSSLPHIVSDCRELQQSALWHLMWRQCGKEV